MNKQIILLFWLTFVIASCAQNNNQQAAYRGGVLSVYEYKKKLDSIPEKQIIDVRTPEEYSTGYIPGSKNINIYDSEFVARIHELEKTQPVFVYCQSGGRSASAAELLIKSGFVEVYDLKGGMMAWQNNNMPVATLSKQTSMDSFSKTQFDKLVTSNAKVMIDFYAQWCAPCKKMEPVINKISKEYKNEITIIRIDVEKSSELTKELNVEELPAIALYLNGKPIHYTTGYKDEKALRDLINMLK